MNIAFNGIGEVCATFLTEAGVKGGMPVKMSGNGTVAPCEAGDSFIGIALEPREGAAAVRLSGFTTVECSEGCPALGRVVLAADGNGGIKAAVSGTEVLVAAVDETAMTAVIYL